MIGKTFATISTIDYYSELRVLLFSLANNNPGSSIFIACDSEVIPIVEKEFENINIKINTINILDKFKNIGRYKLESEGLFNEFLKSKMKAMLKALETRNDVWYLDSDLIILSPLIIEDEISDVCLSKSYISKKLANNTGMFNAGYIWTKNTDFVSEWLKSVDSSSYFDQHCLNNLSKKYTSNTFHAGHNISPWRFYVPEYDPLYADSIPHLSIKGGSAIIDGGKITSLHTHLWNEEFTEFNKLMLKHIDYCDDEKANQSISLLLMGTKKLGKTIRPYPYVNSSLISLILNNS